MSPLVFSIARFTYVPDEYYDTIEAAFAAKPLAEWTAVIPHSNLTLVIDRNPERVIMKCIDGQDIRVPSFTFPLTMDQNIWDLTAIKREMQCDPSKRVVIVKFPHIVFRWYNHQEKVNSPR
jgi:hypothetical protein